MKREFAPRFRGWLRRVLLPRTRRILALCHLSLNRVLIFCLQFAWEPLCWAAGRRGSRSQNSFHRILFIALDNPGDVLLTTPCLTGLKERFPSAKITVLVAEWSQELLKGHPAVSKIITYNAPWFKPWVAHLEHRPFRPLRDFLQCLWRLWQERFDLAIETRGEASHILLAYLSGAPQRVGYALGSVVRWLRAEEFAPLLTHRVPYAWDRWLEWHRVDYNLEVIASLGANPKDSSLALAIPTSARQRVLDFLEQRGIRDGELLIAVQPGTSRKQKCWPLSHFAKVLDTLIERWNARVLVIGSPQEKRLAEDLVSKMKYRPILAAGETTLLEAAALIQRCQLVICNDSVVTHLASAVKTSVITLSRSPSNFYAPYQTRGVALSHRLPCMNPTFHDRCDCPFSEYHCLQEVSPEEVLAAAGNLLSLKSAPTSAPTVRTSRLGPISRPLRVSFDFRSLTKKSRFYGLGTYAAGLFQGLTQLLPMESFSVFLNQDFLQGCDLLHVLDPWPVRNGHCRILATVHDLMPLILQKKHLDPFWSRSKTWKDYERYCELLQRADRLIAISQHTQADLKRVLGIPEDKIRVIYHGFDPRFSPVTNPELLLPLRAQYHLPELFLLNVGSCEYHKNIRRLIEAFARFRLKRRWPGGLVLVGEDMAAQRDKLIKWASSCRVRSHLRILPYLSVEELALLYNAASAVVFPSLYEGFGLPVVEAMACGTPVVTSNVSSLPEVAGVAAVFVDPTSIEAIADGIARVIEEDAIRADLRRRGLLRSATFSWERCANETLEVYLQMVGN